MKTDLGKFTGAERQEYVEELGQEAFDAALRIRDRLVTGGDGEHQIYLCHRFCELGAVPLDKALGQIRDFVVSHPDQVLVIVNEDYVSPEDFVAAVKKSGLDEYVYRGAIDATSPTLGEMISSGHRVVLMAEKDGGRGALVPGRLWRRPPGDAVQLQAGVRADRPEEAGRRPASRTGDRATTRSSCSTTGSTPARRRSPATPPRSTSTTRFWAARGSARGCATRSRT